MLENYVIIRMSILMILLIALTVANIYFFTGRRHTFFTLGIHISSFFGGIYLFCLFIQTSILELPFESYYRNAGAASLTLCIATFLLACVTFVFCKRKSLTNMYITPDLSSVFYAIEDIAVICDYNGKIIEINQSPNEKRLFGEICINIEDITCLLLSISPESEHELIKSSLTDLKTRHQLEINIAEMGGCFMVTSSPIMTDGTNYIGTSIVFHNIRKERELINEIDSQNHSLQLANKELIDYVKVANVLEAEKERLKLLQDLQSRLIQRIEAVISHINNIQDKQYKHLNDCQKDVNLVSSELRDIYKAVRCSINSISKGKGGIVR